MHTVRKKADRETKEWDDLRTSLMVWSGQRCQHCGLGSPRLAWVQRSRDEQGNSPLMIKQYLYPSDDKPTIWEQPLDRDRRLYLKRLSLVGIGHSGSLCLIIVHYRGSACRTPCVATLLFLSVIKIIFCVCLRWCVSTGQQAIFYASLSAPSWTCSLLGYGSWDGLLSWHWGPFKLSMP